MFETLKQKFSEWLEDTAHWLKTGESTIRCYNDGDHHKVYINEWGGTRVDPSEIFRTKRGREDLESMNRVAVNLGITPEPHNKAMTIIYALIGFPGTEEATIYGLFSTRELAEDAQKDTPYSEIQEHYLNPLTEHPPGQQFWYVSLISGEIDNCYTVKPGCGLMPGQEHRVNFMGSAVSTVYCWATDEEHAKEIALDHHEDKWT